MPQYVEVNGNVIEFPDGMSAGDMESAIKANSMSIKPAKAVQAGKAINDAPRQLGLTARYGLEGLANTAQILTEPVRNALANLGHSVRSATPPEMRPYGDAPLPAIPSLGQGVTQALDAAGLPQPRGANERVIGDASRLLAGSGALAGGAQVATKLPGMLGKAGEFLAANLPQQLSSAAGAGLAGGASREAGGGTGMQTLAALGGGVAAGSLPNIISGTTTAAKGLLNRLSPQEVDTRISAILQRGGHDYSQVPERVRQSLRQELQTSLQAGREVDPAALARLADFRTVGATPTRGMVSQNPVQITREMNLAKMGANSSDEGLQGLALLQNRNNSTFIRNLNDAGASQGDAFRAGEAAVGGILGRDAAMKARVSGLYDAARSMPGGTVPLDRTKLVNGVYDALAQQNKLAYLPDDIANTLNTISQGQVTRGGQTFAVPFDAKALDNILTDIATAQRSTMDGNVKAALSIARDAINKMPIQPVKNAFGGNQVVTQQGAQFLRTQDAQAGEFMGALNEARKAAAQRFGWQESAKPIEAALGGMQPDKFVQRFVIGGTVDDARAVAQNAPVGEVKNAIVAHLKEKALGGAADEVGKFSQSAYNKALAAIGDRKLSLYFSPEEIAQMRAVGRAASYAQVQPVGSAVNNSNSGALLLGRGYDALKGIAGKVPLGQSLLVDPLQNIEISLRSNQAARVLPGLLAPVQRQPMGQSLLLPAVAAGGLLAAP